MNADEQSDEVLGWLAGLPILQLLSGYGLALVCFVLGVPIGGWQFFLSAAFVIAVGFRLSRPLGWSILAINAGVLFLTAFTFTYVHCDASICHLPLAHFLSEGWNPVREGTLSAVRDCYAAHGLPDIRAFDVQHVLAAPKFAHVLAAQVQRAFGLFTALGYPLWFLFVSLALSAFRFARQVCAASRGVSLALAVTLCANPLVLLPSFRGLVDFVTYAALVTAGLTFPLWWRTRRRADLFLFFAALVVALASKFTGTLAALVLFGAALGRAFRERTFRRGAVLFAVSLVPFLFLSCWNLPSGQGVLDLTADFVPLDSDGAAMGYWTRTAYAWVSQDFALWACRLFHGVADFSPHWAYGNKFVTGISPAFNVLLWGLLFASLAIPRVRRHAAARLGWILLLTCLLVPTKFIGYPRYVAQIFAALALLAFAILIVIPGRGRVLALCCFMASGLGFALHIVGAFVWQIHEEGVRQENCARIASSAVPYRLEDETVRLRYVLAERLPMVLPFGSPAPLARLLGTEWDFFPRGEGLAGRAEGFWFPRIVRRKGGR